MKGYYLLLPVLCAFLDTTFATAQDSSYISQPSDISIFSEGIAGRISKLNTQFDKKSEKALRRIQKIDGRILLQLYKQDSTAAKNFSIISEQKYRELQKRIVKPPRFLQYIPSLDTLSTSLKYLKRSTNAGVDADNLSKAISHVNKLTQKIRNGEDLKLYLKEKDAYIKDQLIKFGLTKELKQINKNLYYYSEALVSIKETIGNSKNMERKIVCEIIKTKMFQDFIKQYGMLTEMFTSSVAGMGTEFVSLAGLQTRSDISKMIQNQVAAGGPNAQNVINTNLRQGQDQLQQLKNKLFDIGNKGSEDIMPEGFTPNDQRSKPFLKRLELNSNIQAQKANSYLPVAMDLGFGVGYRFSGNAVMGIGASYKMGLGDNIQRIRISHQGVGLRTYADWKFPLKKFGLKESKGSWWLTGGFEQNYIAEIRRIQELRNASSWKASGLIGISNNISFNANFFKGTKLQFLWDFLSNNQIPKTNPIIFRIGFNIQ